MSATTLTQEQKIEIARLYDGGGFTQKQLGLKYGLSQPLISHAIRQGKATAGTVPKGAPTDELEKQIEILEDLEREVFLPVQSLNDGRKKASGEIKHIIELNRGLLLNAHSMFSSPGRRVPVAGQPSLGEYLKEHLPCSRRYVDKILNQHIKHSKTGRQKAEVIRKFDFKR